MTVWIKSTNGDLTCVSSVFRPAESEPHEWVVEAHPEWSRATQFAAGVYQSEEEAEAAFKRFEDWLSQKLVGKTEEPIFEF